MARCEATTKAGKPCARKAKKGEKLCASHLGTARRPSKLGEAQPKIVEALELGNAREGAAAYAGINAATFYRWMETGEADIEQDRQTEQREFREAVIRAEGVAEHTLIAEIRRAASGWVNPNTRQREGADWRAGSWLLERRHPNRWGRREKIEHSGRVDSHRTVDLRRLPDSKLDELDRLLEEASA